MQAAREEMKRRIATLNKHVEHCEEQRRDLLKQVSEFDQQIETDKALAADYEEVLRRLNVTVTYAGLRT
jgi:chaperonin cofactor prefoldin